MLRERSYQFIRKQFFKEVFYKTLLGLCDLHKISSLIKEEINQMYEPNILLHKNKQKPTGETVLK